MKTRRKKSLKKRWSYMSLKSMDKHKRIMIKKGNTMKKRKNKKKRGSKE